MSTLAILLLLASSFAASESIADGKDDSATISGEWRVVSLEVSGRAESGISFRGMRWSFDKETWTTWPGDTSPAGKAGKPPLKARYTLDNSEDPMHLDMILERGGLALTLTKKAIYKIQDGRLFICLGKTERPTSFETKGTKNLCYIAERVAAAAEEDKH